MSFGLGLLCYILGSILVGVCLVAIPGPGGGEAGPEHGHGPGSH
ncbi:MAG TPA: hypothetical protein VN832_08050 [Stellaceae bacterium]|nr:hypothetical protein [Stellaceae bacterium]